MTKTKEERWKDSKGNRYVKSTKIRNDGSGSSTTYRNPGFLDSGTVVAREKWDKPKKR